MRLERYLSAKQAVSTDIQFSGWLKNRRANKTEPTASDVMTTDTVTTSTQEKSAVQAIATAPKNKPAKNKPSLKKTLLLLSPITNLVAGGLLIGSAFLPKPDVTPKPQASVAIEQVVETEQSSGLTPEQSAILVDPIPEHLKPTETNPVSNAIASESQTESVNSEKEIEDPKNILARLGWSMIGVNLFLGTFNSLAFGFVNKQPGMVASSLGTLALAPLLIFNPTILVRSALGVVGTWWFLGLANQFKNENQLKNGETPRQLDMLPLINADALRAEIAKNATEEEAQKDLKALDLMEAWAKQAGKTMMFVVLDPLAQAKELIANQKQKNADPERPKLKERIKTQWQKTTQFARGKSKETPDWLKPSAAQNQFTAAMTFISTVPLLFLAPTPAVVNTFFGLGSIGSVGNHLGWFAKGLSKNDKALIIGIPIGLASMPLAYYDASIGVHKVTAMAAISNHMRKDVLEKTSLEKTSTETSEKETPDAEPSPESPVTAEPPASTIEPVPAEEEMASKDTKNRENVKAELLPV